MSNRLTFSLASLILILGLVFATAPVMAQTPQTPSTVNIDASDDTALAADGYLIIRPDTNAGLPATPTGSLAIEVSDSDWVDLEKLFKGVGGTILLNASRTAFNEDDSVAGGDFRFDSNGADEGGMRDLQVGDLYITEIMWGINKATAGIDTAQDHQWIEIWNKTGQSISDDVLDGLSLDFSYDRPAAALIDKAAVNQDTTVTPNVNAASGEVTLDRVSNVVGAGWTNDLGQSGDTTTNALVPFISMYRDEKADRGRQIADGSAKGSWKQSTESYLANHLGTPFDVERAGVRTFSASGVALTVVFNEIANFPSGSKSHEWIELRVRSGDPHFENWSVYLVDGADDRAHTANPTQTKIFTLPKLDTGRFDDILLITKTDPKGNKNHPLAAGYDVKRDLAEQEREGRDKNIRYVVASDWTEDLPDDGKFVLILRHGNDKTNHEKIEDIAGYHPNLKVDKADFYSDLWPLIGYAAPNLSNNMIEDGEVAKRAYDDIPGTKTKDGNKADKTALRHDNNGWTGIGYKRGAESIAQNGGTPGYPNNAQRSGNDADALGAVIVSEVMPSIGDRNLPEWIELYNTSKTIGVNIKDWRITVQNHDEDGKDGSFAGNLSEVINITGGNARIPPGQTFLIVSRRGRDDTSLPADRVHVVGKKRTEVLINPYGFNIKVESKKDSNYHEVDMVGNLGSVPANARSNAASFEPVAWMLPDTMDADGIRVSIIRVSGKDGPLTGTKKGAWKSFAGSGQQEQILDPTSYGHASDMGSPGHTAGGVLPVSLSKFRPERMKNTGQVVIRWVTESETNNAGFNILRSETRDGEFTQLNTALIAGQGTTSERTAYEFADTSAKPNVVYYYQIQDVSLDGQVQTLQTTHLRGNVTAAGKLTTTWGELKALQ